jgi:hypothetical protein
MKILALSEAAGPAVWASLAVVAVTLGLVALIFRKSRFPNRL